jgi:carboxypeptidase Taq
MISETMSTAHAVRALQELRAVYQRSELICSCLLLAQFDQVTGMPPSGNTHRADQMAFLAGQRHECLADPRIADWLDAVEQSPHVSDPTIAATVRVIREEYEWRARVPVRLASALELASSKAIEAWRAARDARDFRTYARSLDAVVVLKQEEADILREGRSDITSRHDVFFGYNDPGITTQEYRTALAVLYRDLQPLIDRLSPTDSHVPPGLIGRSFPAHRLESLAARFAERIGLDRAWARYVPGLHALGFHIGRNDMRIVTRCEEDDLFQTLLMTAHEVGHARYHHGLDRFPFGDPLMEPASMSMNEAHARLWEAIICKLPEFWTFAYPLVQEHFHDALHDLSYAEFVADTRHAVRSGTRARTDNLSYCIWSGIRSEVEIALLDGTIRADELPDDLNTRSRAIFGNEPSLLRGALADPHWAANWYGRYPTYVLGSIYAAQMWAAIERDYPGVREGLRCGQFEPIYAWLWKHIQQYGRILLPADLMTRATGSPLDPDSWVALMREQHGNQLVTVRN